MNLEKVTLITGVAGTTGSLILKNLIENDVDVSIGKRVIIGIDNLFKGTLNNIKDCIDHPSFIYFNQDFHDLVNNDGKSLFKYLDEVYHMAAVVTTKHFYDDPDLTYKVNVRDTIDLFDWVRTKTNCKRFITGSSSEIYGTINSDDPISEDYRSLFSSVDDTTRWSYAEGKLLCEHYMNKYAYQFDKVCHMRFANTYGPQDLVEEEHIIPYLISHVIRNEDITITKNPDKFFRTFLNNKDSSQACIDLMKRGSSGAYNVGTREEVSILHLLNMIISLSRQVLGIEYTGSIKYREIRDSDPMRRVLDTEKINKEAGWSPKVGLKEGLIEMIKIARGVD